VADLERKLIERGDREVPSRDIGEEVVRRLREIDEVAFVRFASVYRSFKDVEEFTDEIEKIRAKAGATDRGSHDPGEEPRD
jgi:transcriptional repressor NrdR